MPHDPAGRAVRLALAEKSLAVKLVDDPPWRASDRLAAANPALTVPVLIDQPPTGGSISVCPLGAILDYLDDAYPVAPLMPGTSAGRAETRRLIAWFADKFEADIVRPVLRQRIDARLRGNFNMNRQAYEEGLAALRWHFDYVSWLIENRPFLAGERMTHADFTAAAYVSALDYVGVIPWADFPMAKEWYQRMKSRPSFRALLADRVDGIPPASHYDDLDF